MFRFGDWIEDTMGRDELYDFTSRREQCIERVDILNICESLDMGR